MSPEDSAWQRASAGEGPGAAGAFPGTSVRPGLLCAGQQRGGGRGRAMMGVKAAQPCRNWAVTSLGDRGALCCRDQMLRFWSFWPDAAGPRLMGGPEFYAHSAGAPCQSGCAPRPGLTVPATVASLGGGTEGTAGCALLLE